MVISVKEEDEDTSAHLSAMVNHSMDLGNGKIPRKTCNADKKRSAVRLEENDQKYNRESAAPPTKRTRLYMGSTNRSNVVKIIVGGKEFQPEDDQPYINDAAVRAHSHSYTSSGSAGSCMNTATTASTISDFVKIIVGGTEFQECRRTLQSWSNDPKFATASSVRFAGIRCSDPEEWRLIRSLMDPFDSKTRLCKANIAVAMKWFSILSVPQGLDECDKILTDQVVGVKLPLIKSKYTGDLSMTSDEMDDILFALPLALKYSRPRASEKCMGVIGLVLDAGPHWLTLEHLTTVTNIMLESQACCHHLWPSMVSHLPSCDTARSSDPTTLLRNDMFPMLLLSSIQGKEHARKAQRTMKRLASTVEAFDAKKKVGALKRELKKDKYLGKMFRK